MTTPTLAIVDIDLIKQIGVKDFNHFTDHRTVISPEVEPFFGRNLFALRGNALLILFSNLNVFFQVKNGTICE